MRTQPRESKPPPPRIAEELTIDSLAAGGDGVGRLADGRVVFARLSAPGDRVRIEAPDPGASFLKADKVEVLSPSGERVEPPCPVFGRCGGCAWQHISYSNQAGAKEQILRDAIKRIGKFDDTIPIDFIASPEAYGYRGRTRLFASSAGIGYRRHRDHEIEPIESCPVLLPEINRELALLANKLSSTATDAVSSPVVEWALAAGADESVHCVRVGAGAAKPGRDDPRVALRVGQHIVQNSPGGFAQGNALLFDRLYAAVEDSLEGVQPGVLLELFAGAGFFTVGLSMRFKKTVAIESDKQAVRDLWANLKERDGANVKIQRARVEDALPKLARLQPDAVLLDPPRAGLARGAAERLAALGAARIVYLSCDPATLARDLKIICADPESGRARYTLDRVTGIDLFPQTPHVEALAVLNRVADGD